MTDADIYLDRKGAIAELVLNRPDKRNALTQEMWLAIPELLAEVEKDAGLRVLIVRGAGGAFAAGADIAEFEEVYSTRERAARYSAAVAAALDGLAAFPLPTVAKITGPCVGGGCGLALACDLRFATEASRFGITPAKLGLVYTLNDTKRLIDAVGPSNAKDILFSGRLVSAPEAREMGLVDRVWGEADFEAGLEGWLELVRAASPHSARVTKSIIRMILSGVDQDTDETKRMFLDAFQGQDFREGYRAFLEKRAPRFSGNES
ncbi:MULTISPECIES: enoyl-CoA hydratase-related protein [Hyphobacterium]|uniref:Enoyl-CoA hydratase-related protein n=1 Tax=Hyphobacterium vulgare TaxID=1736751 RepID=A0ABV7A1B5_9PROT